MKGRTVWAVFRAEFSSVIRDRRTILTSVMVPVLLYPVGGIALTAFASNGLAAVMGESSKICLAGSTADVAALSAAFSDSSARIAQVPCSATLQPDHEVEAVGVVSSGAALALASGSGVDVNIRYESTDFRGPRARSRLEDALDALGRKVTAQRIAARELPVRFASPFQTTHTDVAPKNRSDVFVWAPAVIVFLVLFSLLGVFLPAIDLTAGDRERFTLETLLTAPVSAADLVVGKFGVVMAMGLVTTALNTGSLYYTLSLFMAGNPSFPIHVAVSGRVALVLFVASVPIVALSGAVCMALGCLARSFRDAQNYLTPAYLGLLIPSYAAALPNAKLTPFSAAVPLVNTPLMLREILAGNLSLVNAFIAVIVNLAFCFAALMIAARLYGNESLAFADAQPLDLLRRPSDRSSAFSPGEAYVLFAVCAALLFYAGYPLQVHLGLAGLVITELVLVLCPPLLWGWWRRIDLRQAFALRLPGWRGGTAAVLFGAGTWLPVVLFVRFLQEPFFPTPAGEEEALKQILGVGRLSWPLLLLVGAALPAVCEEMLLRGAVMQSLIPRRGKSAIVIAALLFAALHMDPWRFGPTFVLGLVAGMVVYVTGSIAAGVLFHFTNNALLVIVSGLPGTSFPAWLLIVAATCLPAATWLMFARLALPHREQGAP